MQAGSTTSAAPDARFLVSHPAHFIAMGFGVGLIRLVPGTFGTLAAVGIFWVLQLLAPPIVIALFSIPLFFVGVWACERTGRDLGVEDHNAMVFDEIVAFLPLAAVAVLSVDGASQPRASWMLLAIAFVLFRLFDIWKPFPIRDVERRVRGGLGVMLDDVLAAFYAYVVFVLFIVFMDKGLGVA